MWIWFVELCNLVFHGCKWYDQTMVTPCLMLSVSRVVLEWSNTRIEFHFVVPTYACTLQTAQSTIVHITLHTEQALIQILAHFCWKIRKPRKEKRSTTQINKDKYIWSKLLAVYSFKRNMNNGLHCCKFNNLVCCRVKNIENSVFRSRKTIFYSNLPFIYFISGNFIYVFF